MLHLDHSTSLKPPLPYEAVENQSNTPENGQHAYLKPTVVSTRIFQIAVTKRVDINEISVRVPNLHCTLMLHNFTLRKFSIVNFIADLSIQSRWNYRHQICPPTWNNQKRKSRRYIFGMIFMTMNIRQQRTVFPERGKASEINAMIAPDYCFETISRLWCREVELSRRPELRIWSWESQETLRAE